MDMGSRIKEVIYLRTSPQNLLTKVRYGCRDRCIRLYTRSMFAIEVLGRIASSSIL